METITEDEGQARLRSMTAAAEKPELSETEQESLLPLSRIPDEYGLLPSYFGWTATWDLARGAAEGWRSKAGKVAGAFDIKGAGGGLSRPQARHFPRVPGLQGDRGAGEGVRDLLRTGRSPA